MKEFALTAPDAVLRFWLHVAAVPCEAWVQVEELVLGDAVPLRHLQTCVVVDLGGCGGPVSAVDLAYGDCDGDSLRRPRVGGVFAVGTPSVWLTIGLVLG